MKKKLLAAGVVLSVSCALGMSACSPSQQPSLPQETYSEPSWMTEHRAQQEEYRTALQACMDKTGFSVEIDINGAISYTLADKSEQAAFSAAEDSCFDSVPLPAYYSGTSAAADYDQQLDVRSCLVSQGYAMPQPPSKDAWVEAVNANSADFWLPYRDLDNMRESGSIKLTQQEWDKLNATCAQADHKYVVSS